ncbi:MAG: RNA polymerase sigma factor [bacterium]|nr:RNA polymerase sigma factor [bacterium]
MSARELNQRLVARAQTGDMDAWARLYQGHFDGLYRQICYIGGDPAASEDLVQDAFAVALASLRRFEGRSTFGTWLHGIGINIARKHRDRRARSRNLARRILDQPTRANASAEPERAHLNETRTRVLYEILDELPEHLRNAFVLRDLQQMEVADAAAQLGVSVANLRTRACRARAAVHDALVHRGWIAPPNSEAT